MSARRAAVALLFSLAGTVSVLAGELPPPPQAPRADAGPGTWNYGPFGYDAAGNVVKIDSQYFIYDVHGRVKTASVERTNAAGTLIQVQAHEFAYDDFGNMTAGPDLTTSLATDPATNHLTVLGAAYDAAGSLVQWTPAGTTINYGHVYDPMGALTEVKVGGAIKQYHVYAASDERIWTYEPDTNSSHWKVRDLDGKVQRDYLNTGTTWSVARDYFYRDGALLAAMTPSGVHHYSLDHLGTPRIVTDASATRIGFHHYFPFGKEWIESGDANDGDVMKFTGHERDADPAGSAYQLDYMHARYYSATLGRFLSMDPLMGRPGMPQSFNRYAYVLNEPLNRRDPTGQADEGAFLDPLGFSYVDFLTEAYGWGRGILDVRAARWYYRRLSQDFAAQDNVAGVAAIDSLLEILPETDAELAVDLAMTFIPIGKLAKLVKPINVLTKGLGHVVQRHTLVGAENVGKSLFAAGENLVTLIKKAAEVTPRPGVKERFVFVVDAGRDIGFDRITGKATRIYTVVTDAGRNLITAFPGLPSF